MVTEVTLGRIEKPGSLGESRDGLLHQRYDLVQRSEAGEVRIPGPAEGIREGLGRDKEKVSSLIEVGVEIDVGDAVVMEVGEDGFDGGVGGVKGVDGRVDGLNGGELLGGVESRVGGVVKESLFEGEGGAGVRHGRTS
jgi:hypothetical protein